MFVISISRDPVRETKNYLKRIIILKYPVSRDIFTRNSTRSTLWETGNPGDSGLNRLDNTPCGFCFVEYA